MDIKIKDIRFKREDSITLLIRGIADRDNLTNVKGEYIEIDNMPKPMAKRYVDFIDIEIFNHGEWIYVRNRDEDAIDLIYNDDEDDDDIIENVIEENIIEEVVERTPIYEEIKTAVSEKSAIDSEEKSIKEEQVESINETIMESEENIDESSGETKNNETIIVNSEKPVIAINKNNYNKNYHNNKKRH